MNTLTEFLRLASSEEKQALAEQSQTTLEYLVHLAKGYRGSAPNLRLAARIVHAVRELHKHNGALPEVTYDALATIPPQTKD